MKILPSLILSLILLVFWSCSDFGVVDNDCSSVVDCAGECGGSAVIDCAGDCGGVAEEDNGNCINISYTATIQPIFDADCTGCHGGSSGLYFETDPDKENEQRKQFFSFGFWSWFEKKNNNLRRMFEKGYTSFKC